MRQVRRHINFSRAAGMKLTPKYHLWIHMVQRISDFIHKENYMVLESHFASGIIAMSRVAVGGVGGLGVVAVCVCGG